MIRINYKKMRIRRTSEDNITAKSIELGVKLSYSAKHNIKLESCNWGNKGKILKKYNMEWEKGIPDFCYEEDGELKFIEVKSGNDGLRKSQLDWLEDYSRLYDVTIVYVIVKLVIGKIYRLK